MADAAPPTLVVSRHPVEDAGRRVADAARHLDGGAGPVRLAVPGGSAAHAIGIVRRALSPGGLWARTALTWVDERCVAFDHPESNRGTAHRLGLLDPGDRPALVLPLFADGETPTAARARVQAKLEEDFASALDVVLLGMGEDGHVASLFPGRAIAADSLVAHVSDSPKPPPDRITLTRRTLATARATFILAMGEGKRTALSRLLDGDATLAAVGLPETTVVTDLHDLGGTA